MRWEGVAKLGIELRKSCLSATAARCDSSIATVVTIDLLLFLARSTCFKIRECCILLMNHPFLYWLTL